jgi:hypothetical protein
MNQIHKTLVQNIVQSAFKLPSCLSIFFHSFSCFDSVSPCSYNWPPTIDPSASASQRLGLQLRHHAQSQLCFKIFIARVV